MKELYFINLFGNINTFAWVIFSILCFASLFLGLAYFIENLDDALMKRVFKPIITVAIICLVLGLFVPTKKDLYIIIGVGSVVDYIEDNDEARQLPDKTVKMLNALADKYTEEENK